MKKSVKYIFIFLGVIVIGAGLLGFITNKENKSADTNWETTKLVKKDLEKSVLATGIVKPQVGAEVRIGSRASGTVTDLYVNVGDYVKKGQLLAILDDAELKAIRDKAQANLENAMISEKYAGIEFQRIKNLKQKEFVSEQVLENTEKQYELSKVKVMQAKADLDYANIQLGYCHIYSSISGVVGSVSTQEGETVSATITTPTFVTIIDLDRLEVWAYVDETDIGRIEVGQKAKFTVDTYTDVEFQGSITAIYPQAEIQNNVVNYIAIIKIEPVEGKIIRPEMTTSVTVYLEKRDGVLSLINRALKREGNKYYVYVLENDKPVKREVTIGLYGKSYTEIIDGLKENERVITNNN